MKENIKDKIYIIYAGVNGAGKSTLHLSAHYDLNMPRINPDEIVKSIGDWKNEKDQMDAAKIAVKRIHEYMKQGISFNQETTLAGRSMEYNIKTAKKYGYQIRMYYVGVDNVEIAKERVKQRVLKGGHDIPEEIIEKRYQESLDNLKKIIPQCDRVYLYDNSRDLLSVAEIKEGEIVYKGRDREINWLAYVLEGMDQSLIKRDILTEQEPIKDEIRKAGYHPTPKLIDDMMKINIHNQKFHSVAEVRDLYRNLKTLDLKLKDYVKEAARDFIQAEEKEIFQEKQKLDSPMPE